MGVRVTGRSEIGNGASFPLDQVLLVVRLTDAVCGLFDRGNVDLDHVDLDHLHHRFLGPTFTLHLHSLQNCTPWALKHQPREEEVRDKNRQEGGNDGSGGRLAHAFGSARGG
jgi:hypothetical protein